MTDSEFDDSPVETGLVAAAVTPIAAVSPAATSPAAVAPVLDMPPAQALPLTQLPDGWTLHKVAALVGDVAQNMYELPYLLKKHGLTDKQYATLQKNEFFQRALEAEIITWTGANSIQKRLALEAAISTEAAMPVLAARLQSKTEPLADVVALMKLFAEIAGVIGAKAAAGGPTTSGERFKIIINLGGETMQREANPSKLIEQAPAA